MSANKPSQVYRRRRFSLFGPLFLIALGVVLFLKTFGLIEGNLWELFLKAWPVLFIVAGLDGIWRGEGYASSVVWAGVGVIFLLGNLGRLPLASWDQILRLWPFLLILWGIDLALSRRSALTAVLGVLSGLAVLGVVFWFLVIASVQVLPGDMDTFQQSLQGVNEADITVEAANGQLWLGAGANAENLVEAQIAGSTEDSWGKDFLQKANSGSFNLKSKGENAGPVWLPGTDHPQWNIKLNSEIPLTIATKMIVGDHTVNLSGLKLEEVKAETVFGKTRIYLPFADSFNMEVDCVFGELIIYVAKGTALQVEADTAFTSITFPEDFTRQDQIIQSPNIAAGNDVVHLKVHLPFGILRIVNIE